jgi:hypothetical protein
MTDANTTTTADGIDTYKDLFRAFIDGAVGLSHRRIDIRSGRNVPSVPNEATALVAYDKWVYAYRSQDGTIHFCDRWTDSDVATNASNIQMGYFKQTVDEEIPGLEQLFKVDTDLGMVGLEGEDVSAFNVDWQEA